MLKYVTGKLCNVDTAGIPTTWNPTWSFIPDFHALCKKHRYIFVT